MRDHSDRPKLSLSTTWALLFCLAAAVAVLAGLHFASHGVPDAAYRFYDRAVRAPLAELFHDSILSPVAWIAVGSIFLMERLLPADPDQRILSVGFAQDTVWLVITAVLRATVLVTYVALLSGFIRAHFGFLIVRSIGRLPVAVRVVWGIVLFDLLSWIQHWLHHKVPVLWQFHTVHHSQRELNMFTNLRYHAVEYFVKQTIFVAPLAFLSVNTPKIVYISLFFMWYSRAYHANVRTNLGPLRYVFVTPQSHRVHHSREARHLDKNFAVVFSFWDRLFGTQYAGYDEYPETGLAHDDDFPLEARAKPLDLVLTPLRQLVYPFRVIARWYGEESRSGVPAAPPEQESREHLDRRRS